MYFIRNDYTITDIGIIGIYIENLPMDFGYYDSFRVTCVETGEVILCRSIPTSVDRRTPTMKFNTKGNVQCQFVVEYKLIGESDYTYIGTVVMFSEVNELKRLKNNKEIAVLENGEWIITNTLRHKGNGTQTIENYSPPTIKAEVIY